MRCKHASGLLGTLPYKIIVLAHELLAETEGTVSSSLEQNAGQPHSCQ